MRSSKAKKGEENLQPPVDPVLTALTLGWSANLRAALTTGFIGGLTTYSTFGFETVRLLADRARTYAVLNVAAIVVAGLGAAFCGTAVAQALWS